MVKKSILSVQAIFCLGLILSLFPTQTFAQETTPVLKIQDQNNEEEEDEEKEKENSEEEIKQENTEIPVISEPEVTEPEEVLPESESETENPEVIQPETPEELAPQPEVVQPEAEKPQPEDISSSIEAPSYVPVLGQDYDDKGYTGSLEGAILEENFITKNYERFLNDSNPFAPGQCTWFAWSRFYQIYGFDSGARGNGKMNVFEIVQAHGDKFEISSTPAAGSVFSMEKNTLYPEFGHSGFVEAFDGEYVWISEGNVKFGNSEGNIWIHKVKWADFKQQFPDAIFAVPKVDDVVKERFMNIHKTFFFSHKKIQDLFPGFSI